jgi:hypothetical protein
VRYDNKHYGVQLTKKKKSDAIKKGRPLSYAVALADEICERIANGESLRAICQADYMPNKSTVFHWLQQIDDFRDRYEKARESQADSLVDDILSIADNGENDTYIDEQGNKRVDTDCIARSRLRVDARKWIAAKLRPIKYGDKVTQEVTGAGGGPVEHKIVREIIDPLGND